MSATFFSGQKAANTGGVLTVSFNSKDPAIYMRTIKQTGWDAKINKPTFSGGETVNFKLTPDEAGGFIHAVNGHDEFDFYHTFNNESSTGKFHYYEVENKRDPAKKNRGFGLTLKKGAYEVKIGFSLGSAERLSQYLQFALDHVHSAAYAKDKKEYEEFMKKKELEKVEAERGKTAPVRNQTVVKTAPRVAAPVVLPDDSPDEAADPAIDPPEIVVEGEGEDNVAW